MATLILQTAGAAAGTALGGPIGGIIGSALGAATGSGIDGALFGGGSGPRFVEGPRLTEVAGLTSTEGDPIPRLYGRARLGGTLIWATRPLETANTTVERAGSAAKGGGGQKTVRTAYAYSVDLAIGLCEGPVAQVRRIWADGRELDLTTLTWRLHRGTADQEPDPLIVAKEGTAPAYRGLAYVVFERLALAEFGNRVPQFAFEVVRPVAGLADRVRAVCLIPGSTEFGLDPALVTEEAGLGASRPANRFQLQGVTDVIASLDALQALCPNLTTVSVVASWFGDDLRAGHCTVAPKVDNAAKATTGDSWRVAGLTRAQAGLVSTTPDGHPAYGGTPSDAGLTRLVAELHRRDLAVVLYPFLMMDVAQGNTLADPRDPAAAGQPPYPWRGRITCDPAPGVAGSPDGTAAPAAQVAAFFAQYRGLVLHYADLAAGWGVPLAGFVVGSECVGLTRVRGEGDTYPAVEGFRTLAHAVRDRLGASVPLVYAADWTEYGAHVRDDGATVRFPLDSLFADSAIHAVGIDYYPPLTDWRDGPDHADLAQADSIYDRAYLKARLGAGEAFDWYYASEADRAAQRRTPITDGAQGKPWVFRPKDLVGWWSNPHWERDGGRETRATAWVPGGKPIWLTEIGKPAVDKGTNGPNVFPDPKSAESASPPFSNGSRDDLIQARGLTAILERFDPGAPGFEPAHNPVSATYGGPMVSPDHVFVWCWDARPYPAFPDFDTVWADAGNWSVGHWITGRIEGLELDRLVAAILADCGIDVPARITGAAQLDGYVLDRPLSARAALEPLARLYGLDVAAVAGTLTVRGPRGERPLAIPAGDLVAPDDDAPLALTRAEESELPRSFELTVTDAEGGAYRRITAAASRPTGARRREVRLEAAVVTRRALAEALAEAILDADLAARDTAAFALSPRRIDLEPGDLLSLPGEAAPHRIVRIADGPAGRRIETRAVPRHGRPARTGEPPEPAPRRSPPALAGPPFAAILNLPQDTGDPTPLQVLAVRAEPWPGEIAVWRAEDGGALALHTLVDHPACLGQTLTPLPPGPLWRFDRATRLDVRLGAAGGLASVPEAAALAGANRFALVDGDGAVEIVAAAGITLVGPDTYRLTGLLRGLAGSEGAAARTLAAGSLVVRLDEALVPLVTRLDEVGRPFRYRIGPAIRDPADPLFVERRATAGLAPFRPLAPVHLRARREGDGVRLAWTRRVRREGDAWDPVDVAPDPMVQGYRVDIHDPGGAVLRSLETADTTVLYADAAADLGGPPTGIEASIVPLGTLTGPGPALRARVPVRAG
ncbi:baseplate multidomain protein megatron [Methylobacterium adhaesivum]|uniref:Glycoside hydrolase/phage tail family protein n=1 Tax=Methylobacterium adhaesivum TaxID=333297 RepID=A0ABT8BDH3_9HYPH|nr:glycoside hydrolase/phage tail family protein [Methylobacterium adhaesivum]MDN3590026.1 glycoside hydrolase/phage tail family protein [Methylobacterium adhaesivum]